MSLHHDLHSHSLASDGTLSPADLVARACAAGVDVLALTDHDSLDGLEEAEAAARAQGLRLVQGVEISVTWSRQTIHVLGLLVDRHNPELQAGLRSLQTFRDWRAEEIGRRLAKAGIEGAFPAARTLARGRIVSRTHFARFLVEQGHAASLREVFKHYLVNNKPGYVSGEWASLEDALGWIRAAGGLAVLAHPARYAMSASKRRRLLEEFRECGGVGMEVVSGSHSRDEALTMAALSRTTPLLASRGSDFHGPENPWVELGRLQELPSGCSPLWESELWSSRAA